MSNRGQVSLEELLLWAALAGMLALLTPVFAGVVHAYSLQTQVISLKSASVELENAMQALAFEGEGSQRIIFLPQIEGLSFSTEGNGIIFSLNDPSLSSPKEFQAQGSLPIDLEAGAGENEWKILRTEEGITIQSQ